jgi:hypothetical protein
MLNRYGVLGLILAAFAHSPAPAAAADEGLTAHRLELGTMLVTGRDQFLQRQLSAGGSQESASWQSAFELAGITPAEVAEIESLFEEKRVAWDEFQAVVEHGTLEQMEKSFSKQAKAGRLRHYRGLPVERVEILPPGEYVRLHHAQGTTSEMPLFAFTVNLLQFGQVLEQHELVARIKASHEFLGHGLTGKITATNWKEEVSRVEAALEGDFKKIARFAEKLGAGADRHPTLRKTVLRSGASTALLSSLAKVAGENRPDASGESVASPVEPPRLESREGRPAPRPLRRAR